MTETDAREAPSDAGEADRDARETHGDPRETRWAALMRAANAGDEASYGRLLREIAPVLRAFARRALARGGRGADADAEDAVQDTLLAIHLKRATWDEARPFGPWMRAVARHKVIDLARRRGRDAARVATATIDDLADILPAPAPDLRAGTDLARHLDALPPRQREAVRAITLDGLSVREAAARLGVGEGAVRVSLHRSLKALARRFADDD